MSVRIDIRCYSAAEMVLLGVFALGLLVASFVVRYRNRIHLSEPIRLPLAGVSVSLPTGGGWQHWEQWRYNQREDVNALSASLIVGSKAAAIVQWRYMAVSESLMPKERLVMRAGTDEIEIVESGRLQAGMGMEWVRARLPGRLEDIFFGTVRLDRGTIVELEVVTFGDAELAGRIFRAVAGSLKFVEPAPAQKTVLSRLRLFGLFQDSGVDCQLHPG